MNLLTAIRKAGKRARPLRGSAKALAFWSDVGRAMARHYKRSVGLARYESPARADIIAAINRASKVARLRRAIR